MENAAIKAVPETSCKNEILRSRVQSCANVEKRDLIERGNHKSRRDRGDQVPAPLRGIRWALVSGNQFFPRLRR